jgi:hypothetical protein
MFGAFISIFLHVMNPFRFIIRAGVVLKLRQWYGKQNNQKDAKIEALITFII